MPAGGGMQRCGVCDVELTSYVCTREHLLGRQHQQKAKTAPYVSSGKQSPYINVGVTAMLCELEIRDIYDALEKFGELSDFRFSVLEKGKTKPKNGSKIYVKYQTRAAGEQALARSQSGQLIHGHTVVKVEQSTGTTSTKQQTKKDKKKEEEASSDPTDHTLLLTTLGHMVRVRTEDDVLNWLADQLLLTPDQHQQRVQLCLDLQAALRSRFRTCLVQAFGSSVSGLGFRGCDLDLYAFIDASNPGSGLPPDADDKKKVRVVADMLYRLPHQLCTHIVRIPHTRVPIVKFRAPRLGGVQCDMSFRDPMSCQNSRLVGWLMKADARARPVTVAVRYWAKRRNLAGGEHHPLKMSSYCLTLLVVTFLQQLRPPVLPSVDWCQAPVEELLIGPWNAAFAAAAVWHSTNTTPASQLLRQFFRFYADFAAELEALCPLLGRPVPRAQLTDRLTGRQLARPAAWAGFCDLVAGGGVEPLAADTPLVLQDPMELNFNVARNFRQLGVDRFRQCCREAADMPLARLFDEQVLPKGKKSREEAAVAAAAAVVAAAANAAASSGDRAAKRSLETAGGRGEEPAARKVKHSSGDGGGRREVVSEGGSAAAQSPEVSSSGGKASMVVNGGGPAAAGNCGGDVTRSAPDLLSSSGEAQKTTAGSGSRSSSVPPSDNGGASAVAAVVSGAKPAKSIGAGLPSSGSAPANSSASEVAAGAGKTAENGGMPAADGTQSPTAAAGAAQSVTSDPALLRRVLADFDRPPSRVVTLPLAASTGSRRPRTDTERRRHAAAFARLLEEVFSVVLRFECRTVTFDGLDLAMDVVRGFTCSARLPTWTFRKMITAQLVGRRRTLEFESEVTERALRMSGHPAPTPLAAFSCYVVLEGDQLRLCIYEGETAKAGKNCHPFLSSFLLEVAKRVDYVALFSEDRQGRK